MIEFSLLCLDRHKNLKNIDEILSHVDSVHLDIMDNIFVKNTAFDTAFINNMSTKLKKHVHIMSINPKMYIDKLNEVETISFHYEATTNHYELIEMIKNKGCGVGMCINPETSTRKIDKYIEKLDRVILMAVNPGFSAQPYIESTSNKIIDIRNISNKIEIVIDGGMNVNTISEISMLGADSAVVCSVIVNSKNYMDTIKILKNSFKRGFKIRESLFKHK